MEKIKTSFTAKLLSVILISLLCTVFVFSSAALVFGVSANLYSESKNKLELSDLLEDSLQSAWNDIVWRIDAVNELFPNVSDNLMYEAKDENGKILYSDVDERQSQLFYAENCFSRNYGYVYHDDEGYTHEENVSIEHTTAEDETTETTSKKIKYTLTVHLKKELKEKDIFYYITHIYNFIANNEKLLVYSAFLSAVLSLALFVYLMCSAGHKKGEIGICISRFDTFPYDILALLTAGFIGLLFALVMLVTENLGDLAYHNSYNSFIPFIPAFFALICIAASASLTVFCITTSVRFKTRTLLKTSLIYIFIKFILKLIKRFFGFCGSVIRKIPTIWKSVLIISAVFMINFLLIMITVSGGEGAALLLLLFDLAIGISAVLFCIMFSDIKTGTEKIAEGKTEEKINAYRMIGDLRYHAENINSINDGIARAVEQKMKSERFKTELITNVSHDIKTPLTSIINYVDLLSKENINNETAEEYIEVLTRQSSKLKKLIDDLLEASKASTGNLAVAFSKLEIGTLFSQTIGEYEERFAENSLEIILNPCSQMLYISADNRHMWRIFDNIFNNIAKYAQPNTRVYIDAYENGTSAEIIFKNVSKEKLNISGEELVERFVRGDSSRNTEGSGLGLSIARSLAELQKGSFDVQIDGDLFKVKLAFPIVNE